MEECVFGFVMLCVCFSEFVEKWMIRGIVHICVYFIIQTISL